MLLDIRTMAQDTIDVIRTQVSRYERVPTLAIVLVGADPASQMYVRNKLKKCDYVGIKGSLTVFDTAIQQEELIRHIEVLNRDPDITGILVQSPLPAHIAPQRIFDTITPVKDVDGFCAGNIAQLYTGQDRGLVPGTPKGVMKIATDYYAQKGDTLRGKTAVIIGKSTIVGKPLALLLLNAGVTVTICHSRTLDLPAHTECADIVISAAGHRHLVTESMVRDGALVIDVGINVIELDGTRRLYGDCDTLDIATKADITPVPGGVGPMTIAMLLDNVLIAHRLQGNNYRPQ